MLDFKNAKPVPIEEVESVESIMLRFQIGRDELRDRSAKKPTKRSPWR